MAADFIGMISARRFNESKGEADSSLATLIDQLESDRGRIINSAAVRRLQQKTQVFPLERNAAVRSRLTHSLEVQQTGRFIVKTLFKQLAASGDMRTLGGLEGALESLVEMACLMHDIGNPPFGHFGEYAINDWFVRKLPTVFPDHGNEPLQQRMRTDLEHFEGNAQAIRLVVKLERLNLTFTQIACLLKYTRPAYRAAQPAIYLDKKPGFYLSEEPFVDRLWTELGIKPGHRHPLTYIMEAADDISYCLADIEDSVEKGIFSIDVLAAKLIERFEQLAGAWAQQPIPGKRLSFANVVGQVLQQAQNEPVNQVSEFFIGLRVNMIHPLVQHAAGQCLENWAAVCEGALQRALMEDESLPHHIVQTFKDVAREWVFCHPEVETLVLQGYRILQGLLDFYSPLLQLECIDFERLAQGGCQNFLHHQLLLRRIPRRYLKAYLEAMREVDSDRSLWEFYYRCRMLQDFISGMTDQHAQDEYRALSAY